MVRDGKIDMLLNICVHGFCYTILVDTWKESLWHERETWDSCIDASKRLCSTFRAKSRHRLINAWSCIPLHVMCLYCFLNQGMCLYCCWLLLFLLHFIFISIVLVRTNSICFFLLFQNSLFLSFVIIKKNITYTTYMPLFVKKFLDKRYYLEEIKFRTRILWT